MKYLLSWATIFASVWNIPLLLRRLLRRYLSLNIFRRRSVLSCAPLGWRRLWLAKIYYISCFLSFDSFSILISPCIALYSPYIVLNVTCYYPNTSVPRPHEYQRYTRLAARYHHFIVEIARYIRMFHSNRFVYRNSHPWIYLPVSCITASYN